MCRCLHRVAREMDTTCRAMKKIRLAILLECFVGKKGARLAAMCKLYNDRVVFIFLSFVNRQSNRDCLC